ncbi:MAG: XrtB/PEP-CTERM-associated polysaccharide biosynthesis outer membrane protein EpsL [Pseudomonadota bacterium]
MNCLALAFFAGAVLFGQSAHAKEGDTFRPFVSAGYYYDSNLFRLADGESPATEREENYALYQAGINVDWKPGRQQFLLNASKTLIRYDRNSYLDFDGDDIEGTWNWRLGNRLSGKLGVAQSASQSSFNDLGLVNNSVDRERRFGRAEWEFHPRWRIGGGVETTDNTNSSLSQVSQNFTQDAYDLVLTYRTPKGSNLRVQVRRTEADYPVMQVLSAVLFFADMADTSFDQTEYLLGGDWRVSGKLALRGQAGWVDREYRNALRGSQGFVPTLVERPDFSGLAARLAGDWSPTGKTLISATLYQETGGASDINASAVLRRGAKLDGVWLVREKWRLSAGLKFENRDYRGDPGTVPGLTRRNDDTLGASVSLSYTPIRMLVVQVGLQAGRRDSNIAGEEYDFHTAFATVRADF